MTTFAEMSPSTLSVAVAPSSLYVSPTVKSIVAAPLRVRVGGVVSGARLTFTVLVTSVAALPAASLTL